MTFLLEKAWYINRQNQLESCYTAVKKAMTKYGYSKKECGDCRLALAEAAINALKHGNQFDVTKTVTIEMKLYDSHVHLSVADEGMGYNPGDVPDPTNPENLERPSGRGLLLIKFYAKSVALNKEGNLISFQVHRQTAVPPSQPALSFI